MVKATVTESTARLMGRSALPLTITIGFPLTMIEAFPVVAL
jgi:hypothetical protein